MRTPGRWTWVAAAVAALIGAGIGRLIYSASNVPSLAAMLGILFMLAFIAVVAVGIVVGAVMFAFDRTAGATVVLVAASLGTGAYLAALYGDGPQRIGEYPAQLQVTFDGPLGGPFSGAGTCNTFANSEEIATVEGEPFVAAGGERYWVSVALDHFGALPQHRVAILAGDPADVDVRAYSGVTATVTLDAQGDRTTGAVTFTGLTSGPGLPPVGGSNGPSGLGGAVQWTCDR